MIGSCANQGLGGKDVVCFNTILIFKDCRKMCSCQNIRGEAISVIDSRSHFAVSNLPSATIQEWGEHQTILTVDKEFKIDFVKQG